MYSKIMVSVDLAKGHGASVSHAGVTRSAPNGVIHTPAEYWDASGAGTGIDADRIEMASHVPRSTERVFASKAGEMAMHADISAFVIR